MLCWVQSRTAQNEVVATFVHDPPHRVSHQVAQAHLVGAEEILSHDGEIHYGAFRLTRHSLTANDTVLPWSAARSVAAEGGSLVVSSMACAEP
jgi:hypothetical protein